MLSSLKGVAAAGAGFLVVALAAWGIQHSWIAPDLRAARTTYLDGEIAKTDEALGLAEKIVRKKFLPCGNDCDQATGELRACEMELRELRTQGADVERIAECEQRLAASREKMEIMSTQLTTVAEQIPALMDGIAILKGKLAALQGERDSLEK